MNPCFVEAPYPKKNGKLSTHSLHTWWRAEQSSNYRLRFHKICLSSQVHTHSTKLSIFATDTITTTTQLTSWTWCFRCVSPSQLFIPTAAGVGRACVLLMLSSWWTRLNTIILSELFFTFQNQFSNVLTLYSRLSPFFHKSLLCMYLLSLSLSPSLTSEKSTISVYTLRDWK
jgi:hypothetical protein